MRFQVPPKTFRLDGQSRIVSGSEFETVVRRLRKPECQMWCDETVEYIVCDGRPNGDRCWRPERQQSTRYLGARYWRHRWTVSASL